MRFTEKSASNLTFIIEVLDRLADLIPPTLECREYFRDKTDASGMTFLGFTHSGLVSRLRLT